MKRITAPSSPQNIPSCIYPTLNPSIPQSLNPLIPAVQGTYANPNGFAPTVTSVLYCGMGSRKPVE